MVQGVRSGGPLCGRGSGQEFRWSMVRRFMIWGSGQRGSGGSWTGGGGGGEGGLWNRGETVVGFASLC